jgi:rubrerythrin
MTDRVGSDQAAANKAKAQAARQEMAARVESERAAEAAAALAKQQEQERAQAARMAEHQRMQAQYQQARLLKRWVCRDCGSDSDGAKSTQGSFAIEIFLWLLMIVPGMLYTLWRLTSKKRQCPVCKSANIVPANSPNGLAILRQQGKVA